MCLRANFVHVHLFLQIVHNRLRLSVLESQGTLFFLEKNTTLLRYVGRAVCHYDARAIGLRLLGNDVNLGLALSISSNLKVCKRFCRKLTCVASTRER